MRIFQRCTFLAALFLLTLSLVSCDTAEKRQRKAATPPPAATAPPLSPPPLPPAPVQVKAEQKPEPKPKTDPVAELIAAVEKEFQAGQNNYAAGHLEAAKQNFDRAFSMLLS